tara:strand:+ start:17 stop:244 length:228 start_codon:yes stop_codon:yes gene_type:complete
LSEFEPIYWIALSNLLPHIVQVQALLDQWQSLAIENGEEIELSAPPELASFCHQISVLTRRVLMLQLEASPFPFP